MRGTRRGVLHPEDEGVSSLATNQQVVAVVANEHIVAAAARYQVVVATRVDGVTAVAAEGGIRRVIEGGPCLSKAVIYVAAEPGRSWAQTCPSSCLCAVIDVASALVRVASPQASLCGATGSSPAGPAATRSRAPDKPIDESASHQR
jgi:hypothetical protein